MPKRVKKEGKKIVCPLDFVHVLWYYILRLKKSKQGDWIMTTYYERNRDELLEKQKEYYRGNREERLTYQRDYYNKNRNAILDQQKNAKRSSYQQEYYQKNKAAIAARKRARRLEQEES